jgi:Beta-propeller repeat
VVQPRPFIYQEIAGSKHAVPGRYVLSGTNQISFEVGAYNPTLPLIIDPVLSYSTYLGGSKDDQAYGIAIDGLGNAYVTGYTYSTNFPTKNAFQGNLKGSYTVFVTKLNASGNAAVYSTYLGGSGGDNGYSIAVDSAGNAYVTGYTSSTDFPTKNALQPANHGGDDAFVTKLNASGNALVYSTYLGGSQDDYGQGITVDSAGNVYLTGYTFSFDFPLKNALQPINHAGSWTAFVTKLNAAGSALVYSTYLGGSDYDQGAGIAVDSAGNVYLTGDTGSGDFPTKNALQKTDLHPGSATGFISKLNASGSALVFSTFLGGSSLDLGQAIAVDSANNIYVTGWTASKDFPTKNPLQPTNHGHLNAFVSKLNASGSALIYSTYLGGKGHDIAYGIALDSKGNAYLTGYTDSANFPVVNALQPTRIAFADVFISELNANGSALNFSTYLGGSSYDDQGNSIAVDSTGNIYVAGYTQSKKFPTKNPFQGTFGGGSYDAFVTKIGP